MQLYELIHSMSKAEKRYFKLYAQIGSRKGQIPKYIALFDLLNSQTEYDEEAVKKKGFGADIKNFLNEKILEALHIFNLRRSPDAELRMLLGQISILFEKKLWSQMRSRLKKARQLAEENERFLILLEILEWEQQLTFKSVDVSQIEQQQIIFSEKQIVQKKHIRESEYEDLATKVYIIRRKDTLFDDTKIKLQFEQLINTPLLSEGAIPPSARSKVQYHQLNYLSSTYRKQFKKATSHLKAIIGIAQHNGFLFHMPGFTAFYVRTLFRCKRLADNKEEEQNIYEIINKLPFKSLDIAYTLSIESLREYTQQLNKNEGKLLIEQMEKEWSKYEKVNINARLCYFTHLATTFYSIFGDWDKSQRWLDKLYQLNRTNPSRDYSVFTRLWQLVTVYERTPEELDKHIQNSYKYLNRHNSYQEAEQQIIQSFKGLCKAISYKERKIIWQNLYDFLSPKTENKKITIYAQAGIPELQIWCQSKIDRTTMAEVIRQKQS